LAFSPDGSLLAGGGQDGALRLWTVADGQVKADLKGHTGAVHALAFSPDGRSLAACNHNSPAFLWNPATGEVREKLDPPGVGQGLAFSDNGGRLLVGNTVLQMPGGRVLSQFRHPGGCLTAALSPEGLLAARGGTPDVGVVVWKTTGPRGQRLAFQLVGKG